MRNFNIQNNNFDYNSINMNGLIRNITNHSQNIISHLIEWSLQKFQLSNIKKSNRFQNKHNQKGYAKAKAKI